MKAQVKIFDTTLRDGEQSPGATMNVAEKVRIAQQLEKLGVDIIAVLVLTLSIVFSRPMLELQDKIQRVRDGDLSATVSFADRSDDIGKLGRNFNEMVTQLRESRAEIERLHNTQMSRAEHLATLGELAAGLAHEIRNPLAGIAGVMDIIGRDLPEKSPARDVLKDVRQEVMRVNRIVSDLLETAPSNLHCTLFDNRRTLSVIESLASRNCCVPASIARFG